MLPKCEDGGKLILRLVLGLLILFHGTWKLQHGVGFIGDMLVKHGLPGSIGYLVYIGEVVAPLMIILGILGRLGALIIVINMLTALALVHTHQFFTTNAQSGGYGLELQFMYLFTALSLLASGMGRFVIGGSRLN